VSRRIWQTDLGMWKNFPRKTVVPTYCWHTSLYSILFVLHVYINHISNLSVLSKLLQRLVGGSSEAPEISEWSKAFFKNYSHPTTPTTRRRWQLSRFLLTFCSRWILVIWRWWCCWTYLRLLTRKTMLHCYSADASMTTHVTRSASSCFAAVCQIRAVRRSVTTILAVTDRLIANDWTIDPFPNVFIKNMHIHEP